MQRFSIILFLLISLTGCSQDSKTKSYIQEIRKHRYEKNIEFADKKTTPLTKKDFKKFSSLSFFPIDSSYRIEAKFVLNENPVLFEMPTTTSRLPIYKTYGTATFNLNGKTHELQVYQNQELILNPEYKDHLFVPFTDSTNGNESYGGGRYIDTTFPKDGIILLDFNKAYNPYCAYNDRYSCPIPPKENHLDIAIKAGVKAFKSTSNEH